MRGQFASNDSGSEIGIARAIRSIVSLMLLFFSLLCQESRSEEGKAITRTPSGEQRQQAASSSQKNLGDLYAVVIGVSKYRNPRVPSLTLSDKDATDFANLLKNQTKLFQKVHVTTLVNEQATSSQVKEHLFYRIRRGAGKDDTVVFFFSGHGAEDPNLPGEFFFITHDGDPDNLEGTAVNLTEMKFLKRLDCKRVVLIADTCHAGGFSTHGSKGSEVSLKKFMNQFRESEGRVILTSCRPDERSLEITGMRNSVFTHYLLKGLMGEADRGKDGIVTLQDLYEFVYSRTKEHTDGQQHPQWEGRAVGPFPIALARLPSRTGTETGSNVSNRPDPGSEARPIDVSSIRTPPSYEVPGLIRLMEILKMYVAEVSRCVSSGGLGDDLNTPSTRSAAASGNADAQCCLGYHYGGGAIGINFVEAAKWLQKAADQGHALSQFKLGELYEGGKGVPHDSTLADQLYRKALDSFGRDAAEGDVLSMLIVAKIYYTGKGGQKDSETANKWYSKAAMFLHNRAKTGDSDAQMWLGSLYYHGRGGSQDFGKALELYRKAAEKGCADAQYWVAIMYQNGQGVVADSRQSEAWFKKAASQGHRGAELGLKFRDLYKGKQ